MRSSKRLQIYAVIMAFWVLDDTLRLSRAAVHWVYPGRFQTGIKRHDVVTINRQTASVETLFERPLLTKGSLRIDAAGC